MPRSAYKISFATKIIPRKSFANFVLPIDKKEQLREICNYAKQPETFKVGNSQKISRRPGLNILFLGPSGDEKKMTVEISPAN